MNVKRIASTVAALSLIAAIGIPASANGDSHSTFCKPKPPICKPTPPVCKPTPPVCPPTGAVPEASDIALFGIGGLCLFAIGVRKFKVSRDAA